MSLAEQVSRTQEFHPPTDADIIAIDKFLMDAKLTEAPLYRGLVRFGQGGLDDHVDVRPDGFSIKMAFYDLRGSKKHVLFHYYLHDGSNEDGLQGRITIEPSSGKKEYISWYRGTDRPTLKICNVKLATLLKMDGKESLVRTEEPKVIILSIGWHAFLLCENGEVQEFMANDAGTVRFGVNIF